MLVDLREYYRIKGISAEGFNCPRQASCRSISADFVAAREAFVGSDYEKGSLPRVRLVSIDASSDHPGRQPADRTLTRMRQWEENGGCNVDLLLVRTPRIEGRPVLRFELFHPRAFGTFKRQRREA